jgi:hypothetical protein
MDAQVPIRSELVTAALADPQTASITGDLRAFLDGLAAAWGGRYSSEPPILLVRHEGGVQPWEQPSNTGDEGDDLSSSARMT